MAASRHASLVVVSKFLLLTGTSWRAEAGRKALWCSPVWLAGAGLESNLASGGCGNTAARTKAKLTQRTLRYTRLLYTEKATSPRACAQHARGLCLAPHHYRKLAYHAETTLERTMLITEQLVREFMRQNVSFEKKFGKLGVDCHFRNHEEAARLKQMMYPKLHPAPKPSKKRKKYTNQNNPGKIKRRIYAATKLKYPGKAGYQKYLKSKWWKQKRADKMQSVDYRCEDCGVPAQEVHHLTYHSLGSEKNKDLQALCSNCHRQKHPEYAILQP
jgi:hypothetical protein